MGSPMEDDETLAEVAFMALDHAVEGVVGDGGPLIPFVLIDRDGSRALRRGVGETLEEGLELVRRAAGQEKGAYTAVAFDGYYTDEHARHDAIFVEAQDPAGRRAVLVQRYRYGGPDGRTVTTVGNPALIG